MSEVTGQTHILGDYVASVRQYASIAHANTSLYPKTEWSSRSMAINALLARFEQAISASQQRVPLKKISAEFGTEALSWVRHQHIPKLIAQYSFYRNVVKGLEEQQAFARERKKVIKGRYEAALETLDDLKLEPKEKRKIKQTLEEEYKNFHRAMRCYARGFSMEEIRGITSEDIYDRVQNLSLPKNILKYGGAELSKDEIKKRQGTHQRLLRQTTTLYRKGQKRSAGMKPEALEIRTQGWHEEIRSLDLVTKLYLRGLSPNGIRDLTGLPAETWLREDNLPRHLSRRSGVLDRKDHAMPATITKEFSYLIGAYFGSTRIFTIEKGLEFRHQDQGKLTELKEKVKGCFGFDTVDPRSEKKGWNLWIMRLQFTKDLFKVLNLKDKEYPIVPIEIIQNKDLAKEFLTGFFDFAGGSLNTEHQRYSICRVNQGKLLKGVALALQTVGILSSLGVSQSSQDQAKPEVRYDLCLNGQQVVATLLRLFPDIGDAAKRAKILDGVEEADRSQLLENLVDYRAIMHACRVYFPGSTKLDYRIALERAGVQMPEDQMTDNLRAKIQRWRSGLKPKNVVKEEALEGFYQELYQSQ